MTLKFCVLGEEKTQEVAVSHYIRSIDADHPGRERLRVTLDEFHVKGPHGTHQCLIFPALGMTLAQLRDLFEDKALEKTLLQKFLCMVLLGLDFLHQAGVVHTGVSNDSAFDAAELIYLPDLSPHNILVGADDVTVSKVEEAELANPSPRKILADRTIHLSYAMPTSYRAPVITDFGSAHIGTPGQKFHGDVMPGVYRAPEIIAGLEWDSKIDIWSFGVMVGIALCLESPCRLMSLTDKQIWDLFEGRSLFSAVRNGSLDDELHFAGMVSLMGPPPKKFLESSQKCRQYWDTQGEVLYGLIAGLCEEATLTKQGNWIAETPIPDQTLESRETRLSGGDKQLLLALARKIFRWLPEDRPSAQDLYKDGFLSQWESEGTDSGSEVPS